MAKIIFKIIGFLVLGALGAAAFEYFAFPYLAADLTAERGKVIVNKTEQVYIQENIALETAVKNAQNSIVAIQKNGQTIGGGLVATSDGSVITLASLTSGKIDVLLAGQPQNFKIIKKDLKNNLALIKIEKNNLQTVGFQDPAKTLLGERVFLAGADFANEGIIRSIDQTVIKTNISEKSAASGTPLFNISGELVGLNFLGKDGNILVVPASTIKTFLGL